MPCLSIIRVTAKQYISIRKMMAHADKYSAAFSAEMYEKIQNGEVPEKDMWRYSSFWYKNFDDMAMKNNVKTTHFKMGCCIDRDGECPKERYGCHRI